MKTKSFISLAAIALLVTGLSGCNNVTSALPSTSTETSTEPSTETSVSTSTSTVDVTKDVVADTKLKLTDEVFAKVMSNKSDAAYDKSLSDFNVTGVERMLTTSDYAPNSAGTVFTNYVDGDTTQFTSYNGNYSVKVRYLAVDTPESTSEIEEWGKSASKFNKSILTNAKVVIVQSAASAKSGEEGEADLDGYQRSLAYVWYSNVSNPTLNDFRNLNLELVFEGYSLFSGSRDDMDSDFYDAFTEANDIAQALNKKRYSDDVDENYYYGNAKALSLDTLYNQSYYTNSDDHGVKYSMYCDEYTKWTFEGVVSRKVGEAFYIQDKIGDNYYGLYVFTLRSYAPIKIGNRIKVSGILSWYGGAYELSGVSYSRFSHVDGDIEYVTDSEGNRVTETVTPIECTPSELQAGKYPCVLVKLKGLGDNKLHFNTSIGTSSYAYGGAQELNTYNEAYPFYNTNNDLVLFGKFGSDMQNVTSFSTLTGKAEYIRIKVPYDTILTGNDGRVVTSYRYFTGTNDADGNEAYQYYISGQASIVYAMNNNTVLSGEETPSETGTFSKGSVYVKGSFNAEGQEEDLSYSTVYQYSSTLNGENSHWTELGKDLSVFRNSFTRKVVTDVIGISQNYESTSGNQKYSLQICMSNRIDDGSYDFTNFQEAE
ncbi:MAG: thermonuclease family protein [Bacilli bacterium]